MLDLIPHEILSAIIDQIPHSRDRNSLCQVSKKLYDLVLPTLYEFIIVRSKNESHLDQTNLDMFLRLADWDYFTKIKSVSFLAPIETNIQFRCVHFVLIRETNDDVIENKSEALVEAVNSVGELSRQIRPFLLGLPDNQLKSFHWHLGTCLPLDILGPAGILATKQSKIEDLSLNTGDPCIIPKIDWEYQISLTEFKSLKKFSWAGGLSREYFDALRDMLQFQSAHLEVLKIDLIDWWDAQWNWCASNSELQIWIREHNFFGEKVLGLASGSKKVLFHSLKSLSLSSIHFGFRTLEMADAFNISNLHSLNLRYCTHTGSLLRRVVESGAPINLRSLELLVNHESENSISNRDELDQNWIVPFLESFQGLKSLRLLLLISGRAQVIGYWPAIYHHQKTLTKLVFHERRYDGWWRDCNKFMGDENISYLFKQTNLQCLGMCISPTVLPDHAFSDFTLAQLSSLKVLCLRITGLEYELENGVWESVHDGFAKWAFKKFPNLLFIASGDFSYGRQFASTQEILHRHPFPGMDCSEDFPDLKPLKLEQESGDGGFCVLDTENRMISHYLEQFRDVLEACPVEPLYKKDF